MKYFVGTFISLLYLALFNNAIGDEGKSCTPGNVTYALCVMSDTNITIVSKEFAAELLNEECHDHFLDEHLASPICHEHTQEIKKEKKHPTAAQRYGYGFLAVFAISALSLVGLLAFPLIYRVSFQYVLITFTALAVGTLIGDAMLHLIPSALGLHSHKSEVDEHGHSHSKEEEDHSSITVQAYQWKMFAAVMVLYGFYLLEVFLHWMAHIRVDKNSVQSHGHSHGFNTDCNHTIASKDNGKNGSSTIIIDESNSPNHAHQYNYNGSDPALTHIAKNPLHSDLPLASKSRRESKEIIRDNQTKGKKSTGWMIIIGDGIHNFADGLAIGAAFSENLMTGLTTTIAIGCHELPHEFGDYAVLIQSGFSHCRALLWNFISATTSFIGFFVGAAVSTSESTRQWIFTITVGMFIYIALVDLLPTLLPEGHLEIKRFISVNIGLLIGITIMFILAVFEEPLLHLGQ